MLFLVPIMQIFSEDLEALAVTKEVVLDNNLSAWSRIPMTKTPDKVTASKQS